MGLRLSQIDEADELLTNDPFALLIGMVLDQQIPLERAFAGPLELARRLSPRSGPGDGDAASRVSAGPPRADLDPVVIAQADPDELAAVFSRPPALHRFPGSMARRVQQLAKLVVDQYDGDAANVWAAAVDGRDLLRRVAELPGFGIQKAKIFVALLGKQYGVRPPGWREAAGPFGEDGVYRSVADITGPETRDKVRDYKKQLKLAAKVSGA